MEMTGYGVTLFLPANSAAKETQRGKETCTYEFVIFICTFLCAFQQFKDLSMYELVTDMRRQRPAIVQTKVGADDQS